MGPLASLMTQVLKGNEYRDVSEETMVLSKTVAGRARHHSLSIGADRHLSPTWGLAGFLKRLHFLRSLSTHLKNMASYISALYIVRNICMYKR